MAAGTLSIRRESVRSRGTGNAAPATSPSLSRRSIRPTPRARPRSGKTRCRTPCTARNAGITGGTPAAGAASTTRGWTATRVPGPMDERERELDQLLRDAVDSGDDPDGRGYQSSGISKLAELLAGYERRISELEKRLGIEGGE